MNSILRILFLVGVVLAIGGTVSEAWAQTPPSATISLTGISHQNRIELELGSTRYYSFTVTPATATVTAASNNAAVTAAISDTASGKLLAVATSATDLGAGNRLAEVTVTVSHPGYVDATVTEGFSINQPVATDHQVVLGGDLITATDFSAFDFGDGERRLFYAVDSDSLSARSEAVSKNGLFAIRITGSSGNQFRQLRVTPLAIDPGTGTYTDTIILTVGSSGNFDGLIAAQHEFTLTINQVAVAPPPLSTDATLRKLTAFPNGGALLNLDPGFDAAKFAYTTTALSSISSIVVGAIATDSGATVQFAVGTNPMNFSIFGELSVVVGDNTLTVRVIAEDGITTQDYTITLTVPARSSDATLSALRVSLLPLTPGFDAAVSTYTATAPIDTILVTVTAIASDSDEAEVQYAVGDPASATFNDHGDLTVASGDNVLTVRVTAEDGSTQDYTITLTVLGNTDATLRELSVTTAGGENLVLTQSDGNTPGFDAAVSTYAATAMRFAPTVTVVAAATDSDANVSYAVGNPASATFNDHGVLAVVGGENVLTARVTAEDGITTQDYTITLTMPVPSTDATLSALSVTTAGDSDLTLTPVFDTAESTYTATALLGTRMVTVAATATDSGGAGVQYAVGNLPGATFSSSGVLTVGSGDNILTARVTAEDGNTQQDYTIRLTVPTNTDATLSALSVTLNGGSELTLTQPDGSTTGFATTKFTYTATAPLGTTMITVAATATDSSASVLYAIGNPAGATFASSDVLTVAVGNNTLTARVTAEDGSTQQDYTITLTVPANTDATLSALSVTLNGGSDLTLTQPDGSTTGFATAKLTYTANVPNFISSVTVAATATDSSGASVQYAVGDPASATFDDIGILTVGSGDSTLTARVTAEDGSTQQDYTITLTVPANSDATLSELSVTLDGGMALTLTPMGSSTTVFTATAPFGTTMVTVSATAADSNAIVLYAVGDLASATDSGDLTVADGENVLTVRVTAEDGVTTQDYTITLTVTVSLLFKIKVFLEGAQ